MPALAGSTTQAPDPALLEQRLRQALTFFEPRLLGRSLRIHVVSQPDRMSQSSLIFEIEGEFWAQPIAQRIFLRTEIDLELGSVKVSDNSVMGAD
jgi:type VI secretion system protein ImpF